MADAFDRVQEAAGALRRRIGAAPSVAIVLGSGLAACADRLERTTTVPYAELPHWPLPTAEGHPGHAVAGVLRGRVVLALAGRCHLYEGHPPEALGFAVRVIGALGAGLLVLTNAAGGVRESLEPGSLMAIDDHVNLTGVNPLMGPNDARFGPRFPDMSQVYSARLRTTADRAAEAAGVPLTHGVYAAVAGPSYETPAEIRYLRTIGVDAVGMSTVPEAIAARHLGLEVLGVSCITNLAAGVLRRPLDHADVLRAAERARAPLSRLLEEIVGRL